MSSYSPDPALRNTPQDERLPIRANEEEVPDASDMAIDPSLRILSAPRAGMTRSNDDTWMQLDQPFSERPAFDLLNSLTSQPFLSEVQPSSLQGSNTIGSTLPSNQLHHHAYPENPELDALMSLEIPAAFQYWPEKRAISTSIPPGEPPSTSGGWRMTNVDRPFEGRAQSGSLSASDAQSIDHNPSYSLLDPFGYSNYANLSKSVQPLALGDSSSMSSEAEVMPFELPHSGTEQSGASSYTSDGNQDSPQEEAIPDTHATKETLDFGPEFFGMRSPVNRGAGDTILSELRRLPSDEDLIKIVCSYPSSMLNKEFYPPFVHHKLYRCSKGGVAESLANALCCVSAYQNMVPSSESFVYNLINIERNRLVKSFHSCSADVDALAVLHAMCIYQILGLLDIRDPEQTRNAELQHLFFLKMTRRMCQVHLRSNERDRDRETAWETWMVAETLRRTVFLVNIVNTLSYRIYTQNPFYYEPLNDDLVFDIALPAPDEMWKACTAEDWEAAKSKCGVANRGKTTVKMVLEKLGTERLDGKHAGYELFEGLEGLSMLIVACARPIL
ncbi:hypothetical protein MMC16_006975 [Acarospora aff. strigata]|nr:hypothetical protein [Acarospora aff. strigata]